ncbi:MAG: hypothetical protein CMO44_16615 [Verrucomicrobiales bacterium]|jgi:hypothetical protein|nr:hypothetical protein [Verrucomicrobiales bacterium]|tara:strand:+ start:2258 stop:2440 length:183 start_codon:yes stop_codon:yes gene_type:complete
MKVPNKSSMFTLAHAASLNGFINEMSPDLEMCCDFIESQGIELTPKVIDQISGILEFANA